MTTMIQGIPVSPTPPTAGQVLALTAGVYTPASPNPGDITAVNTTLPLTGGATSGDVTLDINNFTGDSGSGGLDGTVPAPAAGDAAAFKYLFANGAWKAIAAADLPVGSIVQAPVSVTKTNTFTTTSTTFVDITGMGVSITPTRASNRILVLAMVSGSGKEQLSFVTLLRDSTEIFRGDAAGTRSRTTLAFFLETYKTPAQIIFFIDAPVTTSATVYKLQARCDSAAYEFALNKAYGDVDSPGQSRTPSFMAVMEIAV